MTTTTSSNDDELLTFLLTMQALELEIEDLVDCMESLLARHIREQRRLNRSLPVEKRRIPWSHYVSQITSTHFRRMFRMTVDAFTVLCLRIEAKVGPDVFCSERHGKSQEEHIIPKISGEIKVAVATRMLAGGSYLDLVPLFQISTSHLYQVLDYFLHWVLKTFEFPLVGWLSIRGYLCLGCSFPFRFTVSCLPWSCRAVAIS
jgi:hypothetical protein